MFLPVHLSAALCIPLLPAWHDNTSPLHAMWTDALMSEGGPPFICCSHRALFAPDMEPPWEVWQPTLQRQAVLAEARSSL